MLGPDDALPVAARRILVAGASGSGKTTLARRIASRAGIRHQELEALYHGPDWTPRPEFEADVDALIAGDEWVTEWQYPLVRERLASRAELLVWLDLPRMLVLRRVSTRTVRRSLSGEEIWNGNREGPLRSIFTDPDHIIRWSWRTQPGYARDVPALAERHPGLTIVRLRSPREIERWLAGPAARALTRP